MNITFTVFTRAMWGFGEWEMYVGNGRAIKEDDGQTIWNNSWRNGETKKKVGDQITSPF